MSSVFEGRVRRLGNSMAVIIPKKILEEAGAEEGDVVKLSLPIPKLRRREALRRIAGMDSQAEQFIREERERF
jgi:antitoxin component of MazEF toxin-antitoxin module